MTIQTTTNGNLHEEMAPEEELSQAVCPHLGLADDAETWLAFPAGGNYCYHADPPTAVAMEHQSSHCLSENFATCPAFRQAMGAPLPEALRAPEAARDTRWGVLAVGVLGVIVVVVLVLLLGAWLRNGDPAGVAALVASATPTATTPAVTASPGPNEAAAVAPLTPTATPSPSATPIPPSPTATATAMPSATVTPSLTPSSTPVPDTPTPVLPQAAVTVPLLNVRAGPSTDYPVIGQVAEGGQLAITGQNNGSDWWRVCCVGDGDQEGWIFGETVTVEGDTGAVPVVPIPPLPSATPAP